MRRRRRGRRLLSPPDTGTRRARATHERLLGAGAAELGERIVDRRAQRPRRRLEIVDAQAPSPSRPECPQLIERATEPEPIGLGVHGGGRQRVRERHDRERVRRERPQRLDDVAGAGPERQARRELARHVGAERGGDLHGGAGRQRREARREAQRGGRIGGAAPHPGGDRDPLRDLDPDRRAVPAVLAQQPSASVTRFGPRPRGRRPRRLARRRSASSSSASDTDSSTVTSSWRPSVRAGPRNRHRLTLPGAVLTHRSSSTIRRWKSRGESRSARVVGRQLHRLERLYRAVADVVRPRPERARATRRAPCGGARRRR